MLDIQQNEELQFEPNAMSYSHRRKLFNLLMRIFHFAILFKILHFLCLPLTEPSPEESTGWIRAATVVDKNKTLAFLS